jgi:hypothetical protein
MRIDSQRMNPDKARPTNQMQIIRNVPTRVAIMAACAFTAVQAGTQLDVGKKAIIEPTPIVGSLTFGYQGSEHLNTGYIDSLAPLWTPGTAAVFFNSRNILDDSGQYESAYGLVFRYRIPDQDVILGANVYYDSVDSGYSHHFDQLGIGLEVLTKWIDWRGNYYLPDQKKEAIQHRTRHDTTRTTQSDVSEDVITDTDRRENFTRFESPLEGLNTELGFLIPGLDKVAEVRLFGGYYHYLNPFGSDYDGFKARLEARIRKGVIAEVEYWDDQVLTGGHWTGSLRVTLPCNVFNIFAGRNPFEGAGEAFGPPTGDFAERMSEMVIRSHRVKTASSGDYELTGTHVASETKHIAKNVAAAPTAKPTTPPQER